MKVSVLLVFSALFCAAHGRRFSEPNLLNYLRRNAMKDNRILGGNATEDITMKSKVYPKAPDADMRKRWHQILLDGQDRICRAIEDVDGQAKFRKIPWQRDDPKEGGGVTCVMADGKHFEKAGVNISNINCRLSPKTQQDMTSRLNLENLTDSKAPLRCLANGLSLVIHPKNPKAPTTHCNYRLFQLVDEKSGKNIAWWFGGGSDLTPSFVDEDEAKEFHQVHKEICDKHDPTYYPRFKRWCDRYFWLPHREENRGIGGIFFDDQNDKDPEEIMAFSKDCLNAFAKAYAPLVQKHKNDDFTEEEKKWQQLRRGRYTEYNLMEDRGTKFGFQTPGARTEAILMSLPETARWEFEHTPAPGSWEAESLDVFKHPRDWLPIDESVIGEGAEPVNP
eukprot:Platyproteum_vivax@DN3962_c0_g1_i1.p1